MHMYISGKFHLAKALAYYSTFPVSRRVLLFDIWIDAIYLHILYDENQCISSCQTVHTEKVIFNPYIRIIFNI